ncbi:hypothetical protein TVAG_363580 [Trichomonas vaginalis G3]|uniref:DUF3447 domain-containing protein n=1 Tax=Trichomonas vaginalis (strain ATCC PRA-98 / G3) TaxID=412133 RepID=A2EDS7_TRIV3|nr:protein ubiquitination [Trichomonas vaginalis G3]EAY09143.1 hypothetical protein TVAG_363580 [Trichomonas vaginalis G3]KAI5487068.1 protein ubiquitination [Trichomonas vaginalis G3]|eukprot:XP_001321366.1 hypothetical protein [Trichomonas vaginalis G3]
MSEQDNNSNEYNKLRSIYKYYIDSYIALYQLKTDKEEELNLIYKMIKTELIDSKKHIAKNIIRDSFKIIPYNNRYIKSYLYLTKLIFDENHVNEVNSIYSISNFLVYKEYGIKLDKSGDFEEISSDKLNIHIENTIYRAIMYNDLERFVYLIERDGFDEDQKLECDLYPYSDNGYSLLELCCYHGAVDCFKLLRTKFDSKITKTCLELSFLGRNKEIMSECLKYQEPDEECMFYAIISHSLDFVTFLINEYNLEINLNYCGEYKNLESFLVYFDQTNDSCKCFINSAIFNIPSLCEYFLSNGANIEDKDENGYTALQYAADYNSKEIVEVLILHGANVNEKDEDGYTALHYAAINNSLETAEVLISHGVNIDEKNKYEKTALQCAARKNYKEIVEILISHGANIDEKDNEGKTALHIADSMNYKEIVEILISHGAKK